MIRSPSGSPACWRVRSASRGPDAALAEQRAGQLGQRLRRRDERLRGMPQRRRAVVRVVERRLRRGRRPRTPAEGSARPRHLRLVRALDRPPHVRAQRARTPAAPSSRPGRAAAAARRRASRAPWSATRVSTTIAVAQVDGLVDVVGDEHDRDVVAAPDLAARGPRGRRASARRRTRTARPSAGSAAGRRARGRSPRAAACRRRAATGSGRARRSSPTERQRLLDQSRRRPAGRLRAQREARRSGARSSTGTASGCTPGRRAPSCRAARRPASPSRTSPAVGSSRPAMHFSSVVLPQPDGPTMHTNSPAATSNDRSPIASTSP